MNDRHGGLLLAAVAARAAAWPELFPVIEARFDPRARGRLRRREPECGVLTGFVAANKAVFQTEYVEDGETTAKFCSKDDARDFDGLLKKLDLGSWREAYR